MVQEISNDMDLIVNAKKQKNFTETVNLQK